MAKDKLLPMKATTRLCNPPSLHHWQPRSSAVEWVHQLLESTWCGQRRHQLMSSTVSSTSCHQPRRSTDYDRDDEVQSTLSFWDVNKLAQLMLQHEKAKWRQPFRIDYRTTPALLSGWLSTGTQTVWYATMTVVWDSARRTATAMAYLLLHSPFSHLSPGLSCLLPVFCRLLGNWMDLTDTHNFGNFHINCPHYS